MRSPERGGRSAQGRRERSRRLLSFNRGGSRRAAPAGVKLNVKITRAYVPGCLNPTTLASILNEKFSSSEAYKRY